MALSEVEAYVLELTTEDYTPLADVYSGFRHFMPGRNEDEYIRLSGALVRKFLRLGHVQVFLDNHAITSGRRRIVTELPKEQIEEELLNRSNWGPALRPTPDLLMISIGATDKGEQAMVEHWGKQPDRSG